MLRSHAGSHTRFKFCALFFALALGLGFGIFTERFAHGLESGKGEPVSHLARCNCAQPMFGVRIAQLERYSKIESSLPLGSKFPASASMSFSSSLLIVIDKS